MPEIKTDSPKRSRSKRPRAGLLFDREKLKDYPTRPGVYFMKTQAGEILYIGKAKNLRHRLRSYFQKQSRLPTKIAAMMKQVAQIDVTVVGSELEALLLEARLIKTHLPFFNKKIKDFKSMVFLKVSLNQAFPRISEVSDTEDPSAAYFGPFAGKAILRYKLEILNRVFKLRDCGEKTFAQHQQQNSPCMQYQLGFCSGPCASRITPDAYRESVTDFLRYLDQQPSNAVEGLIAKRDAYIETTQFEKAAALQQQWELMERLQLQQYVLRRALEEHHCLIVLPDTQPATRRILTVIHGQPAHWENVTLSLTDLQLTDASPDIPLSVEGHRQAPIPSDRDLGPFQGSLTTPLADIVARACHAMAEASGTINPAFTVQNGNIAKAMHEESRLISRWLSHHLPREGAVVYLRNQSQQPKTEAQLLFELQAALHFQSEAESPAIHAADGSMADPADESAFDTAEEAWLWEQTLESEDFPSEF